MKKDIMKDMELSKEFFYDEVRDGFYILHSWELNYVFYPRLME